MRQSTNTLSHSKCIVSALAAGVVIAAASSASAQEVPETTPVAPTTPPAVQTAATAAAVGGGLDHDRHVNQSAFAISAPSLRLLRWA